jgi:type I restriction enzyme, S subunit
MMWPTVRLKRLCRLQSGLTVDASRAVSEDAVTRPYLRVANVQAGRLDLESVTEITVSKSVAKSSTLRPGDVLMTEGGDLDKLGRGSVWRDEIPNCLHQNHVFALRPHTGVLDPRYLAYVTQTSNSRHYFERTGTKTTNLASTSSSKILDLPVPFPPYSEQQRIADFLDTENARIDQLVRQMEHQVALLDERRKAQLGELMPNDQPRTVRLGYRVGLVTSGPRGWGDYVGTEGAAFFRSANLQRDSVHPNVAEIVHVRPPVSASPEADRSRVREGDILVGITGANTGWVALADSSVAGANVSQHICLVRPNRNLNPMWLAFFLTSPIVQESLLGNQYGGTKTQLSLQDIRDVRIPPMRYDEQAKAAIRVARAIQQLRRQRNLRLRQKVLLAERRRTLITAAVTGEIDVTTARGVEVS